MFLRRRAPSATPRPISATAQCSNRHRPPPPLRPARQPLPITRHCRRHIQHNQTNRRNNTTTIIITNNTTIKRRRSHPRWRRRTIRCCTPLLILTPTGTASSINSTNRRHRWFRRCTPSHRRNSRRLTFWPLNSSNSNPLASLARPAPITTICRRLRW